MPSTATAADIVRQALTERYGVPVVRVEDDVIRVPGGNAVAVAREALASAGVAAAVEPIEPATLQWYAVPQAGLQLWRHHGQAGDDAELVTEVEAGDPPLQVVAGHEGWQLVRLSDGATGWVEPGALADTDEADPARAQLADAVDPDALAREAERLEGVPYRWGGTSDAGVDCSGLVQRAAWRAGRVWTPRHSTALLKAGTRVAPSKVQRGDVLVLKRIASTRTGPPGASTGRGGPAIHPMHVAIALDSHTALHASRDAWQVVREPLDELRQRYRVLGVRRLAPGGADA